MHDSVHLYQDAWATADDIRNLAASIDRGYERIISVIQSNPHGRGGGVDSHTNTANDDQPEIGGPSKWKTHRAGSTGVKTRSPFENRLSVSSLYPGVISLAHEVVGPNQKAYRSLDTFC